MFIRPAALFLIIASAFLSFGVTTQAQGVVAEEDWDEQGMGLNPFRWFSRGPQVGPESAELTPEQAAEEMLNRAEDLAERGRTRSARRIARRLVRQHPFSQSAPEALFLQGTTFMADGRWDRAFDSFQTLITDYPGFEAFNTVIRKQFDCATALQEGARSRFLFIFPGFRQYNKAISCFEQIVNNAPYSEYAPLSLMNIALIGEVQGKSDVSIDALDRLINFYPQSFLAPDAYFALAETFSDLVQGYEYDQGATREAISYYEDFLILFPESADTGAAEAGRREMENILAQSRLDIGDFYYFYRNNNTAALIFYNETITVAPDSDSAVEARQRIRDIESGVQPVLGNRILRRLLFVN